MSDSDLTTTATSKEFLDLCQAQIAILDRAMGASWSAVYVTPAVVEDDRATKLIQVTASPQPAPRWQEEDRRLEILPQLWDGLSKAPCLPSVQQSANTTATSQNSSIDRRPLTTDLVRQRQIVLPLLDRDTVMGLLVTRRYDREWSEGEYDSIEQIATTLAIACRLDRERDWYRQQLQQQQQQANLEKDRLDDLLHQLRNPITAIRTFSKLLLKRFLKEDRDRSIARSMLKESDRLQDLVEQFAQTQKTNLISPQNLAALPSEDFLNLVPTSVTEVLEPLLVSAKAIATERQIDLKTLINANLKQVKANREALREVASNLIDNALKYTSQGGQIEIEIGIERVKNDLNWQGIAIKNSGTGIAKADREKIFERHYRGVRQGGEIPGSGLGLAIAKKLVAQMAGEIELINLEGDSGDRNKAITIFIIWLQVFNN